MNITNGNENRHFSRIPFNAEVQLNFHQETEVQIAHLRDISLKGALVETTQPFACIFEGKSCRMVFF